MVPLFKRRFIAFILDFFVISAFMWIVSFLLFLVVNPYSMFKIYTYFPIVVPILAFFYFVVLEKKKGATVGKALMFLKVVNYAGGEITYGQAIIRSLSKIFYYFPILFDLLIGKFFGRDRILTLLSKTAVIEEDY